MSHYGPPGGPYPDQPSESWPERQPREPYGQPADPWSGSDPWGGAPASTPPDNPDSPAGHGGYGEPNFPGYPPPARGYGLGYPPAAPVPGWTSPGPDPAWTPPTPAPARGRNRAMIALLVALAVLVSAGGATAFYLLGRNDKTNTTTQPSGGPTSGAPSGAPSGDASAEARPSTPAPESSTDARFVKVGQCVKNEGGGGKPKLAITECAAKTYQVLERFDGATSGEQDAVTKCSKVEDYTDWYFFNSELDALDFVLCLKLR